MEKNSLEVDIPLPMKARGKTVNDLGDHIVGMAVRGEFQVEQPKPENISYSRVKTWGRCPCEHFYKWGMKLEKKAPPIQLIRGKILHELMEARIEGRPWEHILEAYNKEYKQLFLEQQEEFGDIPGDMKKLMEGYVQKYANDRIEYMEFPIEQPQEDGSTKTVLKHAEFPLEFLLFPGAKFKGVMDSLARDTQGNIWVVEHKTAKKLPDDEVRLSALQAILYCWALPKAGYPKPIGILWDYIRTKAPVIPEELKSGGLTKRKNIDTNYQTYLNEITRLGLNPEDYQDILNILRVKQDNFYKRVYFPAPSEHTINMVVDDLIQSAKEIVTEGKTKKTRALSPFTCKGCSYAALCRSELFDMDTEFIIKRDYKLKGAKEEKEEIEEGSDEE